MAKEIIGVPITKEFKPVLNEVNILCKKYGYNRSQLIRNFLALFASNPDIIQKLFYDNKLKSQNPA